MTAVRIATPAKFRLVAPVQILDRRGRVVSRQNHHWTSDDEAAVRRGYDLGTPVREIAASVGVSTLAIRERARSLGLQHRRGQWTLADRFMHFVLPEPNSGCWLWIGSLDRKGYGGLRVAGELKRATHVSLALSGRPIPPGMCVLHRCDTPACVNPDHLFVGTFKDNTQDMIGKGRNSPPPKTKPGQGVKPICLRGHARAITSSGRRICLECGRLKKAAQRAQFVAAGLRCDGVPRNSKIKLSEADIPVIRRRLAAGETPTSIASGYGVTPTSIGHIRHGKTWRYVE